MKGWVRHGSIKWDARANDLAFEIARQDDSGGGAGQLHGVLPDMFAEGREVIVEGRWDGGGLAARQIMTSCPSKYEAKAEQGT